MNEISLGRKIPLIEKPIFLDGISRAGKFFLGKIVSGFEHAEYFQSVSQLEHLPFLMRLGHVSEDAAMSMLQIYVDEHAYYMRIGRNLNFRFDDLSCLNNSFEVDRYVRRSLNSIPANMVDEIKNSDRRPSFVLHETLPNIEIFFKTFPQMQWINLIRHPVDLIHSWYLRGWGHRFGTDALAFVPVVAGATRPIPWFASDWKEDYETMSEGDRIIKSIAVLTAMAEKAYLSLTETQKAQIHTTSYERIITNTREELERMGTFLNMPLSSRMPVILAKEKCPRDIDSEQRNKKIEDIRALASKDLFELMMQMTTQYETNNFWLKS